jgi:hypothetical protein
MEILQLPWSRRCPLVNTPHQNSELTNELLAAISHQPPGLSQADLLKTTDN